MYTDRKTKAIFVIMKKGRKRGGSKLEWQNDVEEKLRKIGG